MLIRIPRGWEIPESSATPENVYMNRRQLLEAAGLFGAVGVLSGFANRNPEFTLDRPITEEWAAEGYNNFYEFDQYDKENVKNLVGDFKISPWKVEVGGLVAKPKAYDLDDIVRTMPLEERLYRHRCVEGWSMAVPWTGFPLATLIKAVEPKPDAKFVRFVSVVRPKEMPGVRAYHYPWPYFEALRMDEAMNPLTLVVTGLYGKPLPKQNGAPIRIVTPWKYGYKSPKSLVKIEFVSKQPDIFWHAITPNEYGFYSNVNPTKPHPRWSQATERVIPAGDRKATLMYNGYEKWVGTMYNGKEF